MHVSSSSDFWDGMNEKFYKKYHGLDRQHKVWMDTVAQGRPIEGPLGRSWKLEMGRDRYGNLKLPINQLVNLPVQGTGADVMMFARISAYKRIKKANIPCDFISTVHDSILVDTHVKYLQEITNIFYQVFDDVPKNIKSIFGYEWQVPMTCECKYGQNMKDQVKIMRGDK